MNDYLIGTQISKFRKAAGLTQEELGEAVGISGQAVSRWECRGTPDVALLPVIADKLGVTLSFVTLWPEPKDGYAAWFAPKNEYRRLFELLSRPGCLELLEYLHCRKCCYFVAQTAANRLEMPCEEVEELLKALEERQILRSLALEMESGEVRAYELADPAAFVPFLYIARCFMQTGLNYIYVGNHDKPLLQKDNWKDQYSSRNAVQTGANFIHFGNYDNSCLSEEENESD